MILPAARTGIHQDTIPDMRVEVELPGYQTHITVYATEAPDRYRGRGPMYRGYTAHGGITHAHLVVDITDPDPARFLSWLSEGLFCCMVLWAQHLQIEYDDSQEPWCYMASAIFSQAISPALSWHREYHKLGAHKPNKWTKVTKHYITSYPDLEPGYSISTTRMTLLGDDDQEAQVDMLNQFEELSGCDLDMFSNLVQSGRAGVHLKGNLLGICQIVIFWRDGRPKRNVVGTIYHELMHALLSEVDSDPKGAPFGTMAQFWLIRWAWQIQQHASFIIWLDENLGDKWTPGA